MPTTRYEIYVKGMLSFVKYNEKEFERICYDLDRLDVTYKTKIIYLYETN